MKGWVQYFVNGLSSAEFYVDLNSMHIQLIVPRSSLRQQGPDPQYDRIEERATGCFRPLNAQVKRANQVQEASLMNSKL